MLRPGFPRLSHPGVAHAISSIAFIAQGYRGRARRFLHDLGGKADRSTATGASTRPVAALVLLVEPGRHPRLDPDVVTRTLGLTPAESQVAVWLADGKSVRDIALATGLTEGAIYWHLKQIYRKLPISRQVDLVRLVLSIAEFG